MSLTTDHITNDSSEAEVVTVGVYDVVFLQLRNLLSAYMSKHPHLSLNGLSKRSGVSEPTLRRIKKGQLKTLPNVSTTFELLTYLTGEKECQKIVAHLPPELGEYLSEKAPQIDNKRRFEFSESLTQSLKDPVKYVIYKLAAGDAGVTLDKVVDLFGSYGETQLLSLVSENLLVNTQGVYRGKVEFFSLSHDVFVEHFKTMADFIKPHKHANARKEFAPVFSNYSASVSKKTYSEIIKIQRQATKKIHKLLTDTQNSGSVPVFILGAVDTIDSLCADEYPDDILN